MARKVSVSYHLPKVEIYVKQLGLGKGDNVQKIIDSEIIRLSDSYVPSDTAYIRRSVFLNTEIGSGKLIYDIYGNVPGRNTWNDKTSIRQDGIKTGGKRGHEWTLRMWNAGGKEKVMLAVKRLMRRRSW